MAKNSKQINAWYYYILFIEFPLTHIFLATIIMKTSFIGETFLCVWAKKLATDLCIVCSSSKYYTDTDTTSLNTLQYICMNKYWQNDEYKCTNFCDHYFTLLCTLLFKA